jgi:hypothetical protein
MFPTPDTEIYHCHYKVTPQDYIQRQCNTDDTSLVGCDSVSLGEYFLTFQMHYDPFKCHSVTP